MRYPEPTAISRIESDFSTWSMVSIDRYKDAVLGEAFSENPTEKSSHSYSNSL